MFKSALNTLGKLLTLKAYRAFVRSAQQGESAQEKVWQECRRLIEKGEYWKKRFSELPENLESFPISEFSDYEEAHREAYLNSSISPLTGETVLYWAMSSGTTGVEKYFPITRPHLLQVMRTSAALFHTRFTDYPGFLSFKSLIPSDPLGGGRSPMQISSGSISTFAYQRTPQFLRSFLSIPVEVMRDSETFNRWGALYALSSDTGSIFAMTPYSLCRFVESADANRKLYLDALEDRIKPPVPLRLSHKRRIEMIQHLRGEKLYLNRIWPNLKFTSVWKSSICASQLPRLESYFEPGTSQGRIVDSVYAATEGWLNLPRSSAQNTVGGANHLGAHVFEYLPLNQPIKARFLLKPWQVEIGKEYELILTNAMGLVRYRIKDVVKVLGFFHQSPIISFQYKSQNLLRLASVTLDEVEISDAIFKATQSVQAAIPFIGVFTVDPSGGDRVIVFYSSAMQYSREQVTMIAERLDHELIEKNFEYAYDRKSEALRPLLMIEVPEEHEVLKKVRPNGIGAQAKNNYVLPQFPASADAIYRASLG